MSLKMAPKKTAQVLLLTQKAEVKEVALPTLNGAITLSSMQTVLKKKENPEILGTYKYRSQSLYIFGYTTGKNGTENKHELPPPYDSTVCFGDIILLATKDSKSWTVPVPFKMADYEAFYTRAFGGFDHMNSEDEDDTGEVEGDIEADIEAEAEAEVDVEEADVDDEDEGGEEDEPEVEAEGEEGEADIEQPVTVRPIKKKKRVVAPAVSAGAAQVYASYLHVPAENELVQESFESPYDEEGLHRSRKKVLFALRKLFKEMLNDEETNQLERCIYNGTLREAGQRHIGKAWSHNPFVEMYDMFAKHISCNFHPKTYVGNTELYSRYKAGEITFKDISEMDTYQIFEERWKDSFMQQQVREKRQLEGNKAMATDQFLCMRCHKRECTYYEMQTRSADEPMTIFITCLNCGKHWRQ